MFSSDVVVVDGGGAGEQEGAVAPPLNFGLSENCSKFFLFDSFRPKIRKKMQLKTSISGKYRRKIDIMSISDITFVGNLKLSKFRREFEVCHSPSEIYKFLFRPSLF